MSERRVYRLQYKFYVAGYEGRKYPRDLRRVPRAVRNALRRAHEEGGQQQQSEVRLGHALYGV